MIRQMPPSTNQDEIDRFSALSKQWWDINGAFAPLHKLNPERVNYTLQQMGAKKRTKTTLLDVGCGGGLFAEKMAAFGMVVTGIDPSAEAVQAAQEHAAQAGLSIDYRVASVEDWVGQNLTYDVISVFEVIEHVKNRDAFLKNIATLLKPDGTLVLATVNRTKKSFLASIVMAEYVLNWLPVGTHEWDDFITPAEMTASLAQANLTTTDITGLVYNPLSGSYSLHPHRCAINYFVAATKA